MMPKTTIEWTERTWNPIVDKRDRRWNCTKVSPGCLNCYASSMAKRFAGREYTYKNKVNPVLDEKKLQEPLRVERPATWFVCSMTDLFHEAHKQFLITPIYKVMKVCSHHTFQVLTKRPENMLKRMPIYWLPNVWHGVSVENADYVSRIDILRHVPSTIRFLSLEPLLGPLPNLNLDGIDWVIVGAESGRKARPMNEDWVRDIRDQCAAAGVAFFYKQKLVNGKKVGLPELDGVVHDAMPEREKDERG